MISFSKETSCYCVRINYSIITMTEFSFSSLSARSTIKLQMALVHIGMYLIKIRTDSKWVHNK